MMAFFLKDVTSVVDAAPTAPKRKSKKRRKLRVTLHECVVDLLTLRCDCDVNCFEKIRLLDYSANVMSDARLRFEDAGHRRSSAMLFDMLLPM